MLYDMYKGFESLSFMVLTIYDMSETESRAFK